MGSQRVKTTETFFYISKDIPIYTNKKGKRTVQIGRRFYSIKAANKLDEICSKHIDNEDYELI